MNSNITHSSQLRSLFLKFFSEKGHAVIPSASVIPENDPTVLFTICWAQSTPWAPA